MRGFRSLVVVGLFSAGCGARAAHPPAGPTGDTRTSAASEPGAAAAGPSEERVAVHIDDAIRRACGISDSRTYFDFDSARISGKGSKVLRQLAQCFDTGPLKEARMRLVGYADPRGEPEYNLLLGGRRASSVKDVLVQDGVSADHIETSSRGEMEAAGHDELSWTRDRRVEVRLATD